MAIKLLVVAALVAVASGSGVPVDVGPVGVKLADAEWDPHPQYVFNYGVEDPNTGDSKSQTEIRDGGIVRGQYSLNDPDGTRRTVDYVADPVNGYNAVVRKEPILRQVAVAVPNVAVATAPLVETRVLQQAPISVEAPSVANLAVARSPVALEARLVQQAPLSVTASPLTVSSPVAVSRASLGLPLETRLVQQAPLSVTASPLTVSSPVAVARASLGLPLETRLVQQAPLSVTASPLTVSSPVAVSRAHLSLPLETRLVQQDQVVTATAAPLTVTASSVSVTGAPVSVTAAPITVTEAPILAQSLKGINGLSLSRVGIPVGAVGINTLGLTGVGPLGIGALNVAHRRR